jgi:hypothetical protein
MAYIIGLLDETERKELERRNWEIEPAPAELIPDSMPLKDRARMAMVWVDSSMFEIMNGPDWDKGEGVI